MATFASFSTETLPCHLVSVTAKLEIGQNAFFKAPAPLVERALGCRSFLIKDVLSKKDLEWRVIASRWECEYGPVLSAGMARGLFPQERHFAGGGLRCGNCKARVEIFAAHLEGVGELCLVVILEDAEGIDPEVGDLKSTTDPNGTRKALPYLQGQRWWNIHPCGLSAWATSRPVSASI
jgi:hypothetical protein